MIITPSRKMMPEPDVCTNGIFDPASSPELGSPNGTSKKRKGCEPPGVQLDERKRACPQKVSTFDPPSFLPYQHPHQSYLFAPPFPDPSYGRYVLYDPFYPPFMHHNAHTGGHALTGVNPPPLTMQRPPYLSRNTCVPAHEARGVNFYSDLNTLADSAVMVARRPSDERLPRISRPSQSTIEAGQVSIPKAPQVSGEDSHAHFSNRVCIRVSIPEDPNWLSELQVYIRQHLLEVCWASREDVAVRNASKKVKLGQVGIRCRYCAHAPPGARAQRSSAFPNTIAQIYQSFTMMLRDHFDQCSSIPNDVKEPYLALKRHTSHGATEAKKYWSYAAMKLGMVDTSDGIKMDQDTRAAASSIPAFGCVDIEAAVPKTKEGLPVLLATPSDHKMASGFLRNLLGHFYRIELLASEQKGNRKCLRLGLPGFGCRHCSDAGRFGMSRIFPARRRVLADRLKDVYDHICRCNLCPEEDKLTLQRLRDEHKLDPTTEKKILDLIWERLGPQAVSV